MFYLNDRPYHAMDDRMLAKEDDLSWSRDRPFLLFLLDPSKIRKFLNGFVQYVTVRPRIVRRVCSDVACLSGLDRTRLQERDFKVVDQVFRKAAGSSDGRVDGGVPAFISV
jgi:hypothetical protein